MNSIRINQETIDREKRELEERAQASAQQDAPEAGPSDETQPSNGDIPASQ